MPSCVVKWCRNHTDMKNAGITFHRYKELFSGGLGRFTGGRARLHVREGAAPVFCRARLMPYALRERVDAELDAMLREGVIESVGSSDWATPLVPELSAQVPSVSEHLETLQQVFEKLQVTE